LLSHGIEVQTHTGARSQFGDHFIKPGQIDIDHGKLYSKLFDLRQKGDYGDLYEFDEETVKPLISNVQTFIDELRNHL